MKQKIQQYYKLHVVYDVNMTTASNGKMKNSSWNAARNIASICMHMLFWVLSFPVQYFCCWLYFMVDLYLENVRSAENQLETEWNRKNVFDKVYVVHMMYIVHPHM